MRKVFLAILLVISMFLILFSGFAMWWSRSRAPATFVNKPSVAAIGFYGSAMAAAGIATLIGRVLDLNDFWFLGVLLAAVTPLAALAVKLAERYN